jgi:protein-S-isoprenylcysteine O-methyltransferase Ste14
MQPLSYTNLVFTGVQEISLILWLGIEIALMVRRRAGAGTQRQDRSSWAVLFFMIFAGFALGSLLAHNVLAGTISGPRVLLFWLGIILVYAGIAFRLYAIRVLGRYFTVNVATVADQRVVEEGPYRFIRHPSYTGGLITMLGFALTYTNWLSLLVIIGCALIGYSYRIHVEEQALQEHLGQPYREYMQRTKRLIPYVV